MCPRRSSADGRQTARISTPTDCWFRIPTSPNDLKAISGLGYQRDLYTIFAGDREVDDFEHWIDAHYEHPGLEAVEKLLRRARMKPSDWKAIGRFVVAQDVRTPPTFVELMRRWDGELPEALDRWLKDAVRRLEEGKAQRKPVPPTTTNSLSE